MSILKKADDDSDPVDADGIREQIRAALRRLEHLAADGRIVMTEDRLNTEWCSSAAAVTAAREALEHANEAMLWMETLPHTDGGYPPITD